MKQLLALWLGILSAFYLGATESDTLLDHICEQQQRITEFKALFEQQNVWPLLDEQAEFHGEILYKNANLKMLYAEPQGQYLLLNDSLFVSYMPQNQQRIEQPRSEMEHFRLDFTSLMKYFRENGNLEKIEETTDSWIWEIIPHHPEQENLSRIEIELSRNHYLPLALHLYDLESNEVHYQFHAYQFVAIPDQEFAVPK